MLESSEIPEYLRGRNNQALNHDTENSRLQNNNPLKNLFEKSFQPRLISLPCKNMLQNYGETNQCKVGKLPIIKQNSFSTQKKDISKNSEYVQTTHCGASTEDILKSEEDEIFNFTSKNATRKLDLGSFLNKKQPLSINMLKRNKSSKNRFTEMYSARNIRGGKTTKEPAVRKLKRNFVDKNQLSDKLSSFENNNQSGIKTRNWKTQCDAQSEEDDLNINDYNYFSTDIDELGFFTSDLQKQLFDFSKKNVEQHDCLDDLSQINHDEIVSDDKCPEDADKDTPIMLNKKVNHQANQDQYPAQQHTDVNDFEKNKKRNVLINQYDKKQDLKLPKKEVAFDLFDNPQSISNMLKDRKQTNQSNYSSISSSSKNNRNSEKNRIKSKIYDHLLNNDNVLYKLLDGNNLGPKDSLEKLSLTGLKGLKSYRHFGYSKSYSQLYTMYNKFDDKNFRKNRLKIPEGKKTQGKNFNEFYCVKKLKDRFNRNSMSYNELPKIDQNLLPKRSSNLQIKSNYDNDIENHLVMYKSVRQFQYNDNEIFDKEKTNQRLLMPLPDFYSKFDIKKRTSYALSSRSRTSFSDEDINPFYDQGISDCHPLNHPNDNKPIDETPNYLSGVDTSASVDNVLGIDNLQVGLYSNNNPKKPVSPGNINGQTSLFHPQADFNFKISSKKISQKQVEKVFFFE